MSATTPEPAAGLLASFGGRFRLVGEYGGGEGRTLCVATAADARRAVLKVLPPGVEPLEAGLLLALRHPAIPAVLEVGHLPDGRAYLLREHRDGEALATLPRDPPALLGALQQLLEVLAFVHLRGVLHLDLKPANLLRAPDGALVLLDFGLGARRGQRAGGGTPFFAAPEQWLGLVPDARADLFAVGAMAAQALWPGGGAPPLAAFVQRFPREDFFAASGLAAADLPPPFDAFVPRCVARDPAQRFADAQAALEFLCGGSGRPAAALLAPDPLQCFAAELRAAAAAPGDVELTGGTPADRRALAIELVARGAARAVAAADDAVLRLDRGGGRAQRIALPRLDAERLLPHLQDACGLRERAARAAATWLVEAGAVDTAAVHAQLLALVQCGAIAPAGRRFAWPAAQAGAPLAAPAAAAADAPPTPDRVQALAAAGQREAAVALHRRGGATAALTAALAAGLLDAGEPAQALPYCSELPELRAQALLDLGRTAAAGEVLAGLAGRRSERLREVRAGHAIACGDYAAAAAAVTPPATPRQRLTLACALHLAGQLEPSEALLRELLAAAPALPPWLHASARTELGHLQRRRGQLAAAQQHFAAAAELLFGGGRIRDAAKAQQNLGVIAKDLGQHDAAVEHLREARSLYAHCGDLAGVATIAANLGIAALARGDAAAARPWLDQAVAELGRLGQTAAQRLAQAMLARAAAELGDRAAAIQALQAVGAPDSARLREVVAAAEARLAAAAAPPPAAAEPVPAMPDPGPSRELFRTFLAVNRQLAQAADLDRAMTHLLDAAVTLTGGRRGYLLVARPDGVRREFESGDPGPSGQAFSRSLAHRAMTLQRTLTGDEALADRELQDAPSIRNLQVRSAVCAPFRSAGGTQGALYVEHPGRAAVFGPADKEALEVLADQAAIAVDRMLRDEALAAELQQSKRELLVARRGGRREPVQLLGDSPALRALQAQLHKLAPLDLPVLVLGETGTGKELVARALHEWGPRQRGPFMAENCSALPAELMERELFGHVQGAFTGADRDRPGLLELAAGGTLFLDEVGDMPPALQAKLLRALQERQIRRVGGSEPIPLDLRLCAATHRDLRAMVQRGEFREDLFFRLAGVEVRVPPLRERGDDVLLLARHFVQQHAAERGRALRLHPAAEAALRRYPWPGNVRELQHVIARAALLSDGDELLDLQLPAAAPLPTAAAGAAPADAAAPVLTLKEAEIRAIAAALQACGGDKAKTARALGISRTALYEKLKRHQLG